MYAFSASIPLHPNGCSRRLISSVQAYACDGDPSLLRHPKFGGDPRLSVRPESALRSDGLPRLTTCGVLVTDGTHLLMGHATLSPRWDIPKGIADPNEPFRDAAIRELHEETGLRAELDALIDYGLHRYRPGKDLALFMLRMTIMPDPAVLHCESYFVRNGHRFREFDRFASVPWEEAPGRTGHDMRRLLEAMIPRVTAAFR